jgi:hypothetical protein
MSIRRIARSYQRQYLARYLAAAGFASLAGVWEGRVRIADDFDELPDELAESLGMRP